MAKKKQIKLSADIISGIRKELDFLAHEKQHLKQMINYFSANKDYLKLDVDSFVDTICHCIDAINVKINNLQFYIPVD